MALIQNKLRVLYLTRWYPNRYDPMPGLFIQRHAEAANKFCQIGVVYTHVIEEEKIKGFDTDLSNINGVFTAKVYYSNPKSTIPILSPLVKATRFYRANTIGIRKIKEELGGFDLIHVHILTRLGFIALWYKWFKQIPFVVSEHWSRYLPLTGDFKGFFRKWFTKLIVKNASVVTTVTLNLANAMQNHGLKNPNYHVLANVVTDDFLRFSIARGKRRDKATFIHVSCFEDKSKNISGLLRVIKSLALSRKDFLFKLVGEGMDYRSLKQYAHKLGLDHTTVVFTGLLEGEKLVREIATSDLMVVFSNYENLPVVINESFVLGVPVIATNVGGIPESVSKENGRLIEAGDENSLERLLNDFLDRKLIFNRNTIKEKSRNVFSPATIGAELLSIYQKVLNL